MHSVSPPATLSQTAVAVLATLVIGGVTLWGGCALWFRAARSTGWRMLCVGLWACFAAACVLALWRGRSADALGAYALGWGALGLWWSRLRPASTGDWADDVARIVTGQIDGDRITLHDVRNFAWRSSHDYVPCWETRTYHLSQLRTVDLFMSHWRGPAIAHMVLSFGFEDGAYLAFSVEVRRRKSQRFSELGGFFKEFELCIIAADEFDVIRLRTNIRHERVYVYRLVMTQATARDLFMAYVDEGNSLAQTPRFYNTVTANCTTLVYRMMSRIVGRLPLSLRLLFSGYIPEYVYGIGGLDTRLPLEELRRAGYASERALDCVTPEHFSADLRRGMPPECPP